METTCTIDWISATFTDVDAKAFLDEMNFGELVLGSNRKGKFGYDQSKLYEVGVLVMWSSRREATHTHVQFSGSCLAALLLEGKDGIHLLNRIRAHNGRTSRVDFAFDVMNGQLHPIALKTFKCRPSNAKGREAKSTMVTGDDGSATLYIGSRESTRYLRIYDKAKEQGDLNSDLIRVELEMKEETAHAAGWLFAEGNLDAAAQFVMGMINEMVDFNMVHWQEFKRLRDGIKMSVPKPTEKDTLGWLIKSCAPALAKIIVRYPSRNILQEFTDALLVELNKLGVTIENDAQ